MSERRTMPYRVAWRAAGARWQSAAYVYRNHRDRMREIRAAEGCEVKAWDVRALDGTR